MLEEKDGWYILNVKDAEWYGSEKFGKSCRFEKAGTTFPHTGAHIFVLEPGKPNCRYHRENAQEDILVLSGSCTLLINEEERELKTWDYVHLPPGNSHVCVGGDQGPCAILIIGHRPEKHELFYPDSPLARQHGAASPTPTDDPRVAYSDAGTREKISDPPWPLA